MDMTSERHHAIAPLVPGISRNVLVALAVAVLISMLVASGVPRGSSGDRVFRCDTAAIEAASLLHDPGGNARQWRRERQRAFQRCMDDAFRFWRLNLIPVSQR